VTDSESDSEEDVSEVGEIPVNLEKANDYIRTWQR
jgi:hypothetical protein